MTAVEHDIGDQLIALLPNMRRFALSLARRPDVADDLVQQACERALAHAASFQPGTRFDAWIFRIIRNLWIDRIRRDKTAGPQDDIEERRDLLGDDGERSMEARLTLASVGEAMARLPDDQRELIVLVCVEDLSYRDAAEILGIPIGTVMSRLARARRAIAAAVSSSPRSAASVSATVTRWRRRAVSARRPAVIAAVAAVLSVVMVWAPDERQEGAGGHGAARRWRRGVCARRRWPARSGHGRGR
jgi:RNA polymerase sigma-70 factor (ECF subfamily)